MSRHGHLPRTASRTAATKPTTSAWISSSGPPWRNSATRRGPMASWSRKSSAQDLERLLRLLVVQQRTKTGGNVLDARTEVAHEVVEIVGVLVLAASEESERLEHHEAPGPQTQTSRDGLLAEDGLPSIRTRRRSWKASFKPGAMIAAKSFSMSRSLPALVGCERRRDEEVHGDRADTGHAPPLPRRPPLLGLVLRETGIAEPLGERAVAPLV